MRIGRVGRPHGTNGAFAVVQPTGRLELLDPGCRLRVAGRPSTVEWRHGTAERPLLKLEGIDDRFGAVELKGAAITVARDDLGPLPPGEHLVDDLIGLEVVDGERAIGRVRDVLLLPSVDCLEVGREPEGTLLVPLVADAIRRIDAAAGRIEVDLDFVEGGGSEHGGA